MATIVKRNKALSVKPLKAAAPVGAALAFLGLDRAIPMLHGSQGCTAFGKVYLVRHFREPIPLQTTAMDQVSAVMGADDNVVEGLRTLCEKMSPAVIGLPTTGLSETEGCDITLPVREFRQRHPEYAHVEVVPLATPDYVGCLETGFADAVRAMVETLVPPAHVAGTAPGTEPERVNVLPGAALTPGDLEALKELIEAFGLRPVVLPDLSDSLDGHLGPARFTPLTTGGTALADIRSMGNAAATLVVGRSMAGAAEALDRRTGVPSHRFDHLMGLSASDALVATLQRIAGRPVPARIRRHRAQLQDAMLDCHFMLGRTPVAVAAEADLLAGFATLLREVGAELTAAVAPSNAAVLAGLPIDEVKIGDLEDLEKRAGPARLLIGSTHAAETARRLGIPLLRAGFPLWDRVGAFRRRWINYAGARDALFDMANLLLEHSHGGPAPYRSIYTPRPEEAPDGPATAPASPGLLH